MKMYEEKKQSIFISAIYCSDKQLQEHNFEEGYPNLNINLISIIGRQNFFI